MVLTRLKKEGEVDEHRFITKANALFHSKPIATIVNGM
jgi:hypothetical protein